VVERGSIGIVQGANASGKTTLLRILSTVVSPDGGEARVNGFDVLRDGAQVRRSIGVLFVNDRSLYWRIDAHDNLSLFGRLAGLSTAEIEERVPSLIDELHLGPIVRERVGRLSTGQRQRLMLARALLSEPSVVLLDEPMRGLDDEGTHVVLDLLARRARAGCTILAVAPLVAELLTIANGTYVLEAGLVRSVTKPPTVPTI